MDRDDWTSVGYENEATVGEIGRVSRAPIQRVQPAAPALLPAHVTRFLGPIAPAQAQSPSVSEARIREIAREEATSATRSVTERVEDLLRRAERTMAPFMAPDAWREEELLYVLGFDALVLDSQKSVGTITALPQRAFRGERLVVDVRRGSMSQNIPVLITGMRVGQESQFVGAGSVPAETFVSSAFGVRLGLKPAAPGIVIAIDFAAGAPIQSTDEIRITAALIGRVRRDG